MYGGNGLDSSVQAELNDLWAYDGEQWTWMSGSSLGSKLGVYGTMGVAAAANLPGGRENSVAALDAAGNFWLFGGYGYPASGAAGRLNDLWKWDGSQWTWVSGSNAIDIAGVYGTKGVPAASNVPGGRLAAKGWIDAQGNFWLFGGYGHDSAGTANALDDLWKFDGTHWTWIAGSNTVNAAASYGTKGVAAPTNTPGARMDMATALDGAGNFWVFGGAGNYTNDLWKWDGTNWTWVSGTTTIGAGGVYGTQGVPSASNVPGGREGAGIWIDPSGNLWIWGGQGVGTVPGLGILNDLWRYAP
jgi:N-acetylneuraminic acid mutarotase